MKVRLHFVCFFLRQWSIFNMHNGLENQKNKLIALANVEFALGNVELATTVFCKC